MLLPPPPPTPRLFHSSGRETHAWAGALRLIRLPPSAFSLLLRCSALFCPALLCSLSFYFVAGARRVTFYMCRLLFSLLLLVRCGAVRCSLYIRFWLCYLDSSMPEEYTPPPTRFDSLITLR